MTILIYLKIKMEEIIEYKAVDKMRSLIAHNPMLLMTMSRFGISLGFGDKSVEHACAVQGVDCPTFLSVCNFISFGTVDLTGLSVETLLTYLKHSHTYYLDFCLPRIRRKLIEAIDCSPSDELGFLILRFYDDYTNEVRNHMNYENLTVFAYVDSLLEGDISSDYSIKIFASGHHSIHNKLQELKEIIVRYLPQKENNLLNAVLFDIISCESDLISHCKVEDNIFVPLVAELEKRVEENRVFEPTQDEICEEDAEAELSPRERDIVACVARGMSNKEMADHLCISVNTVTTHRRNLSQKLQIHSSAGLAIYAVVNGIVDIKSLDPNASRE